MKILHLTRLYSPHIGGVEKHIHAINQLFLKEGHEVTVLTEQYDSNLDTLEEMNGELIFRFPHESEIKNKTFFSKCIFKMHVWKKIWKFLPTFLQADRVHVHDVMWWVFPLYPFIWKKLYLTQHGYEGNSEPTWNQIFWHRFSANLARGVICVGGFHEKWYGVKPDIVTYGAINSKKTSEKSKSSQKIAFIGRLETDNSILEFLQAFKKISKKMPKVSLDVYGDGTLFETAEKFSQKNKLPVQFLGFVPNAEKFLPNYEIIFASRFLSILEAMNAKKKVIARYTNGLTKDYLEMTPFKDWIAIPQTSEEIVTAVFNCFTKDDTDNVEHAYKWVQKQTWKKMSENYFSLWKK